MEIKIIKKNNLGILPFYTLEQLLEYEQKIDRADFEKAIIEAIDKTKLNNEITTKFDHIWLFLNLKTKFLKRYVRYDSPEEFYNYLKVEIIKWYPTFINNIFILYSSQLSLLSKEKVDVDTFATVQDNISSSDDKSSTSPFADENFTDSLDFTKTHSSKHQQKTNNFLNVFSTLSQNKIQSEINQFLSTFNVLFSKYDFKEQINQTFLKIINTNELKDIIIKLNNNLNEFNENYKNNIIRRRNNV